MNFARFIILSMTATRLPELWTCPKCGAQFISKNLWHSCVTGIKLEDLFARSEPKVLEAFHEFERRVRGCGPVTRLVQKTRIVFMVRVRFAGCYPRKSHLQVGFFLKRPVRSQRFSKVEHLGHSDYVHSLRIDSAAEFDEEFMSWVKEAYAVGEQQHLLNKESH